MPYRRASNWVVVTALMGAAVCVVIIGSVARGRTPWTKPVPPRPAVEAGALTARVPRSDTVTPRLEPDRRAGRPAEADGEDADSPAAVAAIEELRARQLLIPVADVEAGALRSSFREARSVGRTHEAIDILAPRHTPIRAVEDGTVEKLFTSKAGGLTIYQFDPDRRYTYYYAHLERYATGLQEGHAVKRGEVMGYVGTSGNAPPGTPHLHFAILQLDADRRWWEGEPIDPFKVFMAAVTPVPDPR